jgi:glucose-6-phosphate dehydrogenase assembly protein OpcA
VADAVAVDSWEGGGVRLGQVATALADLRHRSAGRTPARTAVMTLAVAASSEATAETARQVIRTLGAHHPARVVILVPDPDSPANLDGRAVLYRAGEDDHPVFFEEVTLVVAGQAALHLDSILETFTLADLPVVAWYADSLPDPSDALLNVARSLVVDSRLLGDVLSYRRLLEVGRRRAVVDLSWVRLEPVRELLAGLFDPPALRPFVSAVTAATVKGKSGPRHLLGGWLLAQLRLAPRQVELADARHVQITLTAELHGETATFDLGRVASDRALWAGATVPTGPSPRQVLPLPDSALTTTLATALTRLQGDPVWERSVSSAAALAV